MAVSTVTEHESRLAFERMLEMEVADFRQRYQRYLVALVATLTWAAALRYAMTSNWVEISKPNLPPLLSLILALTLGYLLRRKTILSVTLYLSGLAAAVTLETLGHPGSPALFLF